MNNQTIIQRLRTTLALLVLLLLGGGLLLLMLEKRVGHARHEADRAQSIAQQIRYNMLKRSDAVRSYLLDSKSIVEQTREREADADLRTIIAEGKNLVNEQPDLARTLEAVGDYNAQTLDPIVARLKPMFEADQAGAMKYFTETYFPARLQGQKMAENFAAGIAESSRREVEKYGLFQTLGLALMGLIVVASFFLGRSLERAIKDPLTRLLGAVDHMGKGDFTTRLVVERQDEFGTLADGFNRMSDDLARLIGQVQEAGIRVNQSITEMTATVREQQATTKEVAATTQEISSTSTEIEGTSKGLVTTMGEVVGVAEQTGRSASTGQSGLDGMGRTMQGIMAASATVAEKLAVLNEKAGRINGVVTTINKVADQTNLLSLNAAIEAEKAGEYGLGFAVVAREIRRLADQTAVATYDIERMVKEMESAVNAGVMGMDRFSEEVRHGVEDVRQVGSQLAQIIEQVQELTPRFESVNDGIQSQVVSRRQISESLTQLSEAAQQTAESVEQSNGVVQQLGESARGLHDAVARFKVRM